MILFTLLATVAYQRDPVLGVRGLIVCLLVPFLTLVLPVLGRSAQFPGVVQLEPRYVASGMTLGVLGLVLLLQALHPERWSVPLRRAGLLAVAVVALGVVLTDTRFAAIWSRNPAGAYVANARAGLSSVDPERGSSTPRCLRRSLPGGSVG